VNVLVEVSPDDSPDNYEPVQESFQINPKGENASSMRAGRSDVLKSDNPDSSNVTRKDNKLIWLDNPGMRGNTDKTPSDATGTLAIYFKSTVKPKNNQGQPTNVMMYWFVGLMVKDGKIIKYYVAEVSAEKYYKDTGQKPPPAPANPPTQPQQGTGGN
jgi:hypothetical protein